MIHLATIHYHDDAWIDLQLDHLARHSAEPVRTWAILDGAAAAHAHRFDRVVPEPEDLHPGVRLDLLAAAMLTEADDSDWVVFCHGDCFPVGEWTGPVAELLGRAPLVAIRRDENVGEPMPHPAFAVTTAGFWRELGSTWTKGHGYTAADGHVLTDVGANLWRDLRARGIDWEPLLRSNAVDLHPLWYGIYGGLVYHHGAAFRRPVGRAEAARSRTWPLPARLAHRAWRIAVNRRRSRRLYARLLDGDELIVALGGVDQPGMSRGAASSQ